MPVGGMLDNFESDTGLDPLIRAHRQMLQGSGSDAEGWAAPRCAG